MKRWPEGATRRTGRRSSRGLPILIGKAEVCLASSAPLKSCNGLETFHGKSFEHGPQDQGAQDSRNHIALRSEQRPAALYVAQRGACKRPSTKRAHAEVGGRHAWRCG